MNKFKEKAKEVAEETDITDKWGACTGACVESFTQGAEWGYRQALADSAQVALEQSDIYIYNMETAKEPFFSQYNFAKGSAQYIAKGIIALVKRLG